MVEPKDSGNILPSSSDQLELLLASINHGDDSSSSSAIPNNQTPKSFQRSSFLFHDYCHLSRSFLHENHAFALNATSNETHSRKRRFFIFDQSVPKQFAAVSPEMNNIGEEESEMHENTEEINALLYSDGFEAECDEEETSTGHSPVLDGGVSGSNKRQRILGGHGVRASIADTASSLRSHGSHSHPVGNNDETECVPAVDADDAASVLDRIQAQLNVLESIVPGTKDHNNPLLVLDQAIEYLKSLRVKVQVLGVMNDDDDAVEVEKYSVFKI